jgi:hypothetical protein
MPTIVSEMARTFISGQNLENIGDDTCFVAPSLSSWLVVSKLKMIVAAFEAEDH